MFKRLDSLRSSLLFGESSPKIKIGIDPDKNPAVKPKVQNIANIIQKNEEDKYAFYVKNIKKKK